MESNQKCLRTYTSFLFEASQQISYTSFLFKASQQLYSFYYSLNSTKLTFDSCLNYVTKPAITGEKLHPILSHPESMCWVKRRIIHKIFHFLFCKPNDFAQMNKLSEIYIY